MTPHTFTVSYKHIKLLAEEKQCSVFKMATQLDEQRKREGVCWTKWYDALPNKVTRKTTRGAVGGRA